MFQNSLLLKTSFRLVFFGTILLNIVSIKSASLKNLRYNLIENVDEYRKEHPNGKIIFIALESNDDNNNNGSDEDGLPIGNTEKENNFALDNMVDTNERNSGNVHMTQYVQQDPNIKFQLNQESKKYTFGHRKAGDRLVGHSSHTYRFPSVRNVQLLLNYPSSGYGARISYVEITVNQQTSFGSAKITSGGIGQRSIQILVEAHMTNYLIYTAKFYGV